MNDTKPAFYVQGKDFSGMTLRDYFAAAALQGELAGQDVDGYMWAKKNELAKHVYEIADAMIIARVENQRSYVERRL